MTTPKAKYEPLRNSRGQPIRCRFRTLAGAPCRLNAFFEDHGCHTHSQDPEAIAHRRATGVKGGMGRKTDRRVIRLLSSDPRWAPIADRLATTMDETLDGHLDPMRATAISQVARAMVTLVDLADATARIEELESALAALKAGPEDGEAEVFMSKSGRTLYEAPVPEGDEPAKPDEPRRGAIPYDTKGQVN